MRPGELEMGIDVMASLKFLLPILPTVTKQQGVGTVPAVTLLTHCV